MTALDPFQALRRERLHTIPERTAPDPMREVIALLDQLLRDADARRRRRSA